ncbi:putative enzyme related to lactoylglutathione lyase [Crossiella equi]|uniref:Enzyme related to lactoylglutathione lyase n=1 Tax=Crossiella equi TaxID=130796 RepID=A0ABS5A5W6_9PSEU|nr:VOC family protein [Crossiella equi]MBP2471994.1 putative enzyme related to lactoylglutathione lyase [Crossiella equi]
MSQVDRNQPLGTPTWIDLAVTDPQAAQAFYGTVFGWEFATAEGGTHCLLRGLPVAGLHRAEADHGWTVHLATEDCDLTAARVTAAGGTVLAAPHEVGDLGRAALAVDPSGARFGLWQGRAIPGCQLVNEPGTLIRNDLVTARASAARPFYAAVFDFTLDGNQDLPGMDFTYLRRPDGHEIGGILGLPEAPASAWVTTFQVTDIHETVARVRHAGGSCPAPEETPYGRSATVTDPFGTEFTVMSLP